MWQCYLLLCFLNDFLVLFWFYIILLVALLTPECPYPDLEVDPPKSKQNLAYVEQEELQ